MVDISSDGFFLLLLDVDERLRTSPRTSAADEMSRKLVAHLIKGEDSARLQCRVSISCCFLQGRWKSLAQDGIWRAMEQHHCLEGLQVVNQIQGSIVALKLGELEVRWDRFLYNHLRKRRVSTDILTVSSWSMTELLDPSVHLLKPLIQEIFSITNLMGLLAERW